MNQIAKKIETVIDPVCGMAVNPETATASAIIERKTYYFCADGCRNTFVKDPRKYLEPKPEKKKGLKGLWCRYLTRLKKATGGKAMGCH